MRWSGNTLLVFMGIRRIKPIRPQDRYWEALDSHGCFRDGNRSVHLWEDKLSDIAAVVEGEIDSRAAKLWDLTDVEMEASGMCSDPP